MPLSQSDNRRKYLALIVVSLLSCAVFAQAPVISSFSPTSGVIGTTVTITGANFNASPAGNTVFFGAVKAPVSAASPGSLTVTVPLGATYQPLSVTTGNLTAYSAHPFVTTFPGVNTDFNSISFADAIRSQTGLYPYGVVIVDLDGDGKPDLATANNANSPVSTISVLRNVSAKDSIAFEANADLPAPSGSTPYSIAAGDIDGDGKQDLVVTNNVASTVSVYRNTSIPGAISFAPRVEFATGSTPFSVAIGDLDGDGRPDLAVADYLPGTVSIFRNTSSAGSVSFAAKTDIPTLATPRYVTMGDIDGDGKPDLAIANERSSAISVIRNTSTTGALSFATRVDLAVAGSPTSIAIGDLDGDGKADLAVSNYGKESVGIIRNASSSGNISLSSAIDFPTGSSAYHVAIGDLNGDGKPDLAVATTLSVYVYNNNSTSGNISLVNPWNYYDFPPYFIALGDLDGDTKPDLVAANFTHSNLSIFRNKFNEPAIASFSPTTAATGATVTITGANFTSATAVNFGGTPAASFT
ncbi:MAG TPA: FG-GAP-like repeat-containing protein, partial [Puia sp.]